MVLIFTAGNRHLFKVIFLKLKSAWILVILAAERGGGEHEPVCPVFVHLSTGCRGTCVTGVGAAPVPRDRGSRLSCWRVLSVLAPPLAGQSLYLMFRVTLSSFLLSGWSGQGMPRSSEGAVLSCSGLSGALSDPCAGPTPVFMPGWFGHCTSVGSSLVLWVSAMAPGPGFAGSTTFAHVLAAGLPL